MNYLSRRISSYTNLLQRKIQFNICGRHRFKSWKILFFGSDYFSMISLEALLKCLDSKKIQKLEVVVLSDRNEISKFARNKTLKMHMWPPDLTSQYDLGVIVSFGKLIPKHMIDHFPLGIINVHPSLLPKYRGAMPIFHTLRNGDSETGITIMRIKPFKFDIGDIVMQKTCSIGSDELHSSLEKKLAHLGAQTLVHTIEHLPHSLEKCVPQPSNDVSLAPKIQKDIAIVKWGNMTAAEVYNLYRGLFGIYGLKTTWCSKQVQLLCISLNFLKESKLFDNKSALSPGTLEYCRETQGLRVHCTDKPLYICSIQVGHKLYTASQFFTSCLRRSPKKDWMFK